MYFADKWPGLLLVPMFPDQTKLVSAGQLSYSENNVLILLYIFFIEKVKMYCWCIEI